MNSAVTATRVAVDIGGTFTDVVLEHAQTRYTSKVLTTPSAPEHGVLEGLADVLGQAQAKASDIELMIHGTTLATNAIIERKGARTALITTQGFRDVLEIGYESRYNQYDIMIEKPATLVPRERRLTVRERMDVKGNVLAPLDEAGVEALCDELVRLEAQSLAVGFLHAYANPEHELRARELINQNLPELAVSLSSEVCPEVREYERLSTTVANAYVRPLMESYLGRLESRFRELGAVGPILLMTSGGGLTTLETAMRFPIRLVESGPAGGAILAGRVAHEMGLRKVISFDMGGTTAKICLIENYEPRSAREFEVDRAARFTRGSGLPLRIPVIEMVEIGAGGGSIARLDALNRIAVGPDSAGAEPGPAAYDRGGKQPTITDADIVLGRIDPESFAGGKVKLAPVKAEAAVMREIGAGLGLDAGLAAYGITEMVDETMANAARVHAVEQGQAAADHTLIAFGGAAPLHVCRLAEKLAIEKIVIPTDAGVGSAVGFLRAPVAYEVVRSRNMRLIDFDPSLANQIMREMVAEALVVVEAGAPSAELTVKRGAFMRYAGQGHEVYVPLPNRELEVGDRDALQSAYNLEYETLFQRTIPDAEVEVLTWAVSVATETQASEPLAGEPQSSTPRSLGNRTLIDPATSATIEVPLYSRAELVPGSALSGPAVIAETQTSTFVGTRFQARVASNGYLVIERRTE